MDAVDPIQKAIDEYILMERKAAAFDKLVENSRHEFGDTLLSYALADFPDLVHPASATPIR